MATLKDRPIVTGDRILRLPEVLERIGISRTRLYVWIGAGEFPAPLKLTVSGTAVGWRASDIDQWIADRVNPTDAARVKR